MLSSFWMRLLVVVTPLLDPLHAPWVSQLAHRECGQYLLRAFGIGSHMHPSPLCSFSRIGSPSLECFLFFFSFLFCVKTNGTNESRRDACQIEYDEARREFYLCDLGSLNGTYMQMVSVFGRARREMPPG